MCFQIFWHHSGCGHTGTSDIIACSLAPLLDGWVRNCTGCYYWRTKTFSTVGVCSRPRCGEQYGRADNEAGVISLLRQMDDHAIENAEAEVRNDKEMWLVEMINSCLAQVAGWEREDRAEEFRLMAEAAEAEAAGGSGGA